MEQDFTSYNQSNGYPQKDISLLNFLLSMKHAILLELVGGAGVLASVFLGYDVRIGVAILITCSVLSTPFVLKAILKPSCPQCGGKMEKTSMNISTCHNCQIEWKLPNN